MPAPAHDGARAPEVVETWHSALSRRLRTLVRLEPLLRLEATKASRGVDLSQHDLRALALRALDATIERMGLGSGATRDELTDALAPLVRAAEPDASKDRIEEVVAVVLEGLLNERERRIAFSETYVAFEGETAQRRTLSFRLLAEEDQPSGAIVVRATTEAINLYAGMLEYDVEDAQAADEAVLRSQIRRGRIAQAVATARQARVRSVEYELKLSTILERTRRDVSGVDWVRDVLVLLAEALRHLEDRQAVERELVEAVEQRLESAEGEEGAQLAELRDTLRECLERHLSLHRKLMSSNRVYLDEQARQAFRPRCLGPLPDLEAGILRPLLALPQARVSGLAAELLRVFHAPRAPAVIFLPTLVELLLAPRRRSSDADYDLEPAHLVSTDALERRFLPEEREAVAALLGEVGDEDVPLSALLARARERGLSTGAENLLVLQLLLAFDPEDERSTLGVRRAGTALEDETFRGDDLLIRRATAASETARGVRP